MWLTLHHIFDSCCFIRFQSNYHQVASFTPLFSRHFAVIYFLSLFVLSLHRKLLSSPFSWAVPCSFSAGGHLKWSGTALLVQVLRLFRTFRKFSSFYSYLTFSLHYSFAFTRSLCWCGTFLDSYPAVLTSYFCRFNFLKAPFLVFRAYTPRFFRITPCTGLECSLPKFWHMFGQAPPKLFFFFTPNSDFIGTHYIS